jgi:hypothetical protein
MKTIKILIASILCGAFAISTAHVQAQTQRQDQEQIEQWDNHHQLASRALGDWVKAHPQAAHYIFEWDGHHPDRSQQFVTWAIDHPRENLAVFHAQHKDWPEMDEIEKTHKDATEAFLHWCRTYGPAARALMAHPGALRWAGDHLYKDYLTMEHPNK